jgi:hypothetical protein
MPSTPPSKGRLAPKGTYGSRPKMVSVEPLGRPVDSSMVTVMVFGTPTYTVV